MSSVTCQISMSLDGFVAGPDQSLQNPLGEGGMRLHQWAFATDSWREQHGGRGGERNTDAEVIEEVFQGVGAYIMGRNMFGGGPRPLDESWKGWWERTRPTTCRSSCSRTTRASRWRCRAARRSRS